MIPQFLYQLYLLRRAVALAMTEPAPVIKKPPQSRNAEAARQAVVDFLKDNGKCTAYDVTQQFGWDPSTSHSYLRWLHKKGLVVVRTVKNRRVFQAAQEAQP